MRSILHAFIPVAFAALALTAGAAPAATLRSDVRDLGRVGANVSVSIAATLAYRHASELHQLVRAQSNRQSPLYRHYLTSAQFDAYFAPSAASYAGARAALQRAGFHVTQTFANRTVVDASAPARVAERYFSTEIRRVRQAGVGIRYASLDGGKIPLELRGLVTTVSGLSNLDIVKPYYRFAGRTGRGMARARALASARSTEVAPGVNVVSDPGFESGRYGVWRQCGAVRASLTKKKAHRGHYSEFAGSLSGNEIRGVAGLCQAITIPERGVLSFWVDTGSTETSGAHARQFAVLMDARRTIVATLYDSITNTHGWQERTFRVPALARRTLYLYFGVRGDGRRSHHTYQFVDDVDLPNGPPSAPPAPVPTALPATPTSQPDTPVAGLPGGSTVIGGPLYGPDGGYGPLATAQAYDLPVQHGYNGAGRAAGVVMWADYLASDLTNYENYWGLARTGATSRVAVDGGAAFDANINDPSNASIETELDVETLEGNAPGANVYVYEIPAPTDQSIVDAYDAVVAANVVDVVNSSFGGCESGDPAFAAATETIAEQGSAEGITFVAAAGDSGSNECGLDAPPDVSAPAGGPSFVSVGGTSLGVGSGGDWNWETVWNSNGGAGGGGVSSIFSLPAYQQNVSSVIAGGRNQPDISLAADPDYGASFLFDGAWVGPIGGTSWSTPIFTAYVAQVAQQNGARAGSLTAALYGVLATTNYTYYHDITSGTNFGYAAGARYDQASGIGSIASGYALATQLP